VATWAVAVELREQLLARKRELDSREGTISMWENGLAASKHALGRVRMEHDVRRIQDEAALQDYLARTHAFSFWSKQLINLNRMLEEHQILLYLQEKDLEVQELMLVEE
jgi:hypothetical protein